MTDPFATIAEVEMAIEKERARRCRNDLGREALAKKHLTSTTTV